MPRVVCAIKNCPVLDASPKVTLTVALLPFSFGVQLKHNSGGKFDFYVLSIQLSRFVISTVS